MKNKMQPNEVERDEDRLYRVKSSSVPSLNDPKIMSKMRKNRHMSGLMCPPMGAAPLPRAADVTKH